MSEAPNPFVGLIETTLHVSARPEPMNDTRLHVDAGGLQPMRPPVNGASRQWCGALPVCCSVAA